MTLSLLMSLLMMMMMMMMVDLVGGGSGDMFTSMIDMQRALQAEQTLSRDIRLYIDVETDRLGFLRRLADELEEHSRIALADTEHHIANPVNAFLLIKRFSVDWKEIIDNYVNDKNSQSFLEHFASQIRHFPDKDDLFGSIKALLRLQDVYALSASQIANGIVDGEYGSPVMSASDCFILGTVAYNEGDFYHTALWMIEALKLAQGEADTILHIPAVLDYLSIALYKQGNILQARNLTLEWLRLEPNHERALSNLQHYNKMAIALNEGETSSSDPFDLASLQLKHERPEHKETEEFDTYEALCRGEKTHVAPPTSQLTCQYRRHLPMFYINPLHEEVLFLDPKVVMYHDIMTNADIARIKELAIPKLHRSGVFLLTPEDNPFTDYRTSKSAWLADDEDSLGLLRRLTLKASGMSNLTLDTVEDLQVLNYGIGGQYEPHFDFARPNEISSFEEWRGNRIATIIFYMTDVQAGGGTAFNAIGLHTTPRKGSCVLWYNLLRDGEGDYRTKHAGCPVLIGYKWVCNKWFHVRGQEFNRQCSLTPERASSIQSRAEQL